MKINESIESVRKEIRYYNSKLWIILFVFSFLVVFLISLFPEFYRTINLIFPIMFIVIPWIMWSAYQLTLFRPLRYEKYLKYKIFEEEISESKDTLGYDDSRKKLYYDYESLLISFSKLKRVGRFIEILIAFELAIIPLVIFYINLVIGRW